MKVRRLLLLFLVLLPGSAWAQGFIQNMDIYFLFGPTWYKSQGVPGSTATIGGSTGMGDQIGYGYQVARTRLGGLWADFFPMTFAFPGTGPASIKGSASFTSYTATPGIRFMVPVQKRLSIYGVAGAGYGQFQYVVVDGGDSPFVRTKHTTHGVIDFGGGFDIRLSQRFSFRAECRDFVTGKGLSGAPGRHHIAPLAGFALHF